MMSVRDDSYEAEGRAETAAEIAAMPVELRTDWVRALRSGEYVQGQGQLRTKSGVLAEHCCIGVLCEVAGVEFDGDDPYFYGADVDEGGNEVWAEVNPIGLRASTQRVLAVMNDDGGMGFAGIADFIEGSL